MRIGVIGLGHRLVHLVKEFAKAGPEVEVTAIADPSEARMQELVEAGIEPARYDDAREMMGQHRFDLLMIGSPNSMHLDHLKLALESDVPHIFVEKPVVVSVAETMELARLIAKHDGMKRLMIGLVLRYSPLYRALKSAQAEGQLGEIMSIEASEHIAPYHGSFFMRDWRRDESLSGGFMLEKCCHDLDLYQGVVGSRPLRIASFGGRKKYLPEHRPQGDPDYLSVMQPRWGGTNDAFSGEGDLIDYQTALVEYEGGANLAFHTNLNVPDEFRRFAVIGRDGMAEGDFIRNYFRVTDSDSGRMLVNETEVGTGSQHGHYGADEQMSRDILDHLSGKLPELPLDVTDALEAGVTALVMDVARREGRIVELSEIWAEFDDALGGAAA